MIFKVMFTNTPGRGMATIRTFENRTEALEFHWENQAKGIKSSFKAYSV